MCPTVNVVRFLVKVLFLYLYCDGVKGVSYDENQLQNALDLTLDCLERYQNLTFNATFSLAYGLATLPYVPYTAPNVNQCTKKAVVKFQSRLELFFANLIESFPDAVDAQLTSYPQYFSFSGDFRFKTGRIPLPVTPLDQTVAHIYDRSASTPEGYQCYSDLIRANPPSPVKRVCELKCQDQAYDLNFEEGLTSEERWLIVGMEELLNCTNHTPREIVDAWLPICTYQRRQLETLINNRDDPMFDAVRFHFLNKILGCSASGFPEFLTENLLSYIYGSIRCDGCVGRPGDSDETIQVLTAETASILTMAIRLIQEESNGLTVFT